MKSKTTYKRVKYQLIVQVLNSRNDLDAKYKAIEVIVDGLLSAQLSEVISKIREIAIIENIDRHDVGWKELRIKLSDFDGLIALPKALKASKKK